MPDLLIRNLSEETKRSLSVRAAEHGNSVQAEASKIINDAVRPSSGWVGMLMSAGQGAESEGFAFPERHAPREFSLE